MQVNGIAAKSPLPLTVKIRLGENDDKINVEEVVGLLQAAGAAAVTVHGRWGGGGVLGGCSRLEWVLVGVGQSGGAQPPGIWLPSFAAPPEPHASSALNVRQPADALPCFPQTDRTMLQRYKRPASWELIERVARMHSVPVVGNGDVLTHYEARRRIDSHGCHAVMVGR